MTKPRWTRATERLVEWLVVSAVVGLLGLWIFSGPPEPRYKLRQPPPAAAEPAPAPPAYACDSDNGEAAMARCQRGDWLYVADREALLRYCQLPSGLEGLPAPPVLTTPLGVFCRYRGEVRISR